MVAPETQKPPRRAAHVWKFIQWSIVAAVVMSNIYWQWTPNGLLAGLVGGGAAFIVTWIYVGLTGRGRQSLSVGPSRSAQEHLSGEKASGRISSPTLSKPDKLIKVWPQKRIR